MSSKSHTTLQNQNNHLRPQLTQLTANSFCTLGREIYVQLVIVYSITITYVKAFSIPMIIVGKIFAVDWYIGWLAGAAADAQALNPIPTIKLTDRDDGKVHRPLQQQQQYQLPASGLKENQKLWSGTFFLLRLNPNP